MKKPVKSSDSGSIRATGAQKLDTEVLIVGSGFSGIGAGIKLKEAGVPFIVLEKRPTSVAPGAITHTPASQSTLPLLLIRFRMSSCPTGRACLHPAVSSKSTPTTARKNMACVSICVLILKSNRAPSMRRRTPG